MVREVLACLAPQSGDTVVDCTVGYGGHARRLIEQIGSDGRFIGLDTDGEQLEQTRRRLSPLSGTIVLHHASFSDMPRILAAEQIGACDVIFADLGLSSMQIDDPDRGISYKHADAPLDMRMNRQAGRTAADVLATLSQEELSAALDEFADEPDHAKIAQWIVGQRQVTPLTTTAQLIRLVMDAKGLTARSWRDDPSTRHGELHPAARTFQALRILVNDELSQLQSLLDAAGSCLADGGRIGIISFHSGEDRLVKQAFRQGHADGLYERISAKPLTPRVSEVRTNPRSASAKLRWAVKGAVSRN